MELLFRLETVWLLQKSTIQFIKREFIRRLAGAVVRTMPQRNSMFKIINSAVNEATGAGRLCKQFTLLSQQDKSQVPSSA